MEHTALSANEFFISERIVVVAQSLNSRPYDCFLFWKTKNHFKGYHFGTLDNVRKIVTEQFKFGNKFQHRFQEWKHCLWRCIGCTLSRELVSWREQCTIFVKRRTNVATELAVLLILTHHVYPVPSPVFLGFSLYRVASRLTNININGNTMHKTRDTKINFGRVFRQRNMKIAYGRLVQQRLSRWRGNNRDTRCARLFRQQQPTTRRRNGNEKRAERPRDMTERTLWKVGSRRKN